MKPGSTYLATEASILFHTLYSKSVFISVHP
jgi:hypothetical protein